jgi:hypothetical protein
MAYKTIPIYNLDAAVGPRQANRPDDVKLVQCLLRLALKQIPDGGVFTSPKVTGILDDATRTGIVAFQRWMEFKDVKRDDVVDPMPSKRGGVDFESVGPNGHIYTIYYLNIMARRTSPIAHDNAGKELGLMEAAGFRTKLPSR